VSDDVPQDAAEPIAGLVAGQLSGLARRLVEGNVPGSLDGLMAHHVLAGISVPFEWNVDPFVNSWITVHADRLDEAPNLAALGFGLAHFSAGATPRLLDLTCRGLRRLMQRDPFQGDRLSFLYDMRQATGIRLAVAAVSPQIPEAADWLRATLRDPRRHTAECNDELVAGHTLAALGCDPAHITDTAAMAPRELATVSWMIAAGTARLADPLVSARELERVVLAEALRCNPRELRIPTAALLLRCAERALSASIDEIVVGRSHVGQVLRRFEAALRRWRWDPDDARRPVRWEINAEREVQDILWIMLRTVFDDVVDEETLAKLGHASYRADFGLPRLGVLIEAKFARKAADFKEIEQQVMVDSIGYLKNTERYKEIVVFIYDDSSSVEQHDVTYRALMEMPGIADVIIVSRPGVLPRPTASMARRARGREPSTR
jgi:hypothetical protein